MSRRYYDDQRAVDDFVAWSFVLLGTGLLALVKSLRPKPDAYNPKAPDDPTHIPQIASWWNLVPKLDWSKAKPPKIDLSDPKNPKFSWEANERPQWVKAEETPAPFSLPTSNAETGIYRIFPQKDEGDPAGSVALIRSLLLSCPRVNFEIVADGDGIFWQITDPDGQYAPQVIMETIKSHHPTATVVMAERPPSERTYPFFRQLLIFGLINEYAAPLPLLPDLTSDPLFPLTNRMSLLQKDLEEQIRYRLLTFVPSAEAGRRGGSRLVEGMVKLTSGIIPNRDDPLSGFDMNLVNAKLEETHYHCFLTVTLESRSEARLTVLSQLATDLAQLRTPRHNGLALVGSQTIKREITDEAQTHVAWFETLLTALVQMYRPEWRRFLLVLTPPEIATLWHLPNDIFLSPAIVWGESAVPAALTIPPKDETQAVCLGEANTHGKTVPIYLAIADRAYHHYMAGMTGMGKSTLMHNLIHQDIAAGRGLAVIDPHGQLIDAILERSIPAAREQDVVVLNCGDTTYPVPLNPFRIPAGVSFARAADYVYWVIRKIYESIWHEGRMDLVMRNVIQALLCDPDATPLDIRRLLMDDTYRATVVARVADHEEGSFAVMDYWREFDDMKPGERRAIAQPILNRTGAFLGNRALENMTCHPNALSFQEFIAGKKIVLINLFGEAIRNEVGSLGAMLLAHFFLASEALGYIGERELPRFFLYVDEAERIITSPLPDMFAQARKFGLSLFLANQYLDQVASETLSGILGNVGTQFLFELGSKDLETFARSVKPEMQPEALLRLGAFHAAVKTRSQGQTLPPFVLRTKAAPAGYGTPHVLAQDGNDGQPASEVRAWLKTRYAPPPKPEPPAELPKTRSKDGLGDYEP